MVLVDRMIWATEATALEQQGITQPMLPLRGKSEWREIGQMARGTTASGWREKGMERGLSPLQKAGDMPACGQMMSGTVAEHFITLILQCMREIGGNQSVMDREL